MGKKWAVAWAVSAIASGLLGAETAFAITFNIGGPKTIFGSEDFSDSDISSSLFVARSPDNGPRCCEGSVERLEPPTTAMARRWRAAARAGAN